MAMLLGESMEPVYPQAKKQEPTEQKPFAPPVPNANMHRVFADLLKTRGLDADVVSYFARRKLLYEDARQVLVYGIGRMCHIAFWEPHFADEYETEEVWLAEPCRIGARLHPFTIEQNTITSFRSSWPLIPCYANTIGPKIIFGSDYAIGGADGVLSRGMQWQGMSFWMTLRYGHTKAVTSSCIPTMPSKLFLMQELAGPLCADIN